MQRKAQFLSSNSARQRTLGSDSTRDYTGVERSFPLYARAAPGIGKKLDDPSWDHSVCVLTCYGSNSLLVCESEST